MKREFCGEGMFLALALSLGAVLQLPAGGGDAVAHRREARQVIADRPAEAMRYLGDEDAAVRKYALFKAFEADSKGGAALAKRFREDPDEGVRALARELSRERAGGRKRAPAPLPLSQDPNNDHEFIKVKTIPCSCGVPFVLPEKPDCDGVEVWLGPCRTPLDVWINDTVVASYDPAVDGERDFRFDASAMLRWGAENMILVTNERGRDHAVDFTLEVFKCGK